MVTALLFNVGKFLIGLYLSHSAVASSYGAAGALIIVLLWIYYSAQIFLLGAEFDQDLREPPRHSGRHPRRRLIPRVRDDGGCHRCGSQPAHHLQRQR